MTAFLRNVVMRAVGATPTGMVQPLARANPEGSVAPTQFGSEAWTPDDTHAAPLMAALDGPRGAYAGSTRPHATPLDDATEALARAQTAGRPQAPQTTSPGDAAAGIPQLRPLVPGFAAANATLHSHTDSSTAHMPEDLAQPSVQNHDALPSPPAAASFTESPRVEPQARQDLRAPTSEPLTAAAQRVAAQHQLVPRHTPAAATPPPSPAAGLRDRFSHKTPAPDLQHDISPPTAAEAAAPARARATRLALRQLMAPSARPASTRAAERDVSHAKSTSSSPQPLDPQALTQVNEAGAGAQSTTAQMRSKPSISSERLTEQPTQVAPPGSSPKRTASAPSPLTHTPKTSMAPSPVTPAARSSALLLPEHQSLAPMQPSAAAELPEPPTPQASPWHAQNSAGAAPVHVQIEIGTIEVNEALPFAPEPWSPPQRLAPNRVSLVDHLHARRSWRNE